MIFNDRKASADQHGKSPEKAALVGKAVWHCPAVQRLETVPATQGKRNFDAAGSLDVHE